MPRAARRARRRRRARDRVHPRNGVPRGPRPRVSGSLACGHNPCMTPEDLRRLGEELGLDAVGVARAEAYEDTERHIVERRTRGLFAGMKFTMAHPEQSCHPESLLPDARSVVSAALCYWRPEAPLEPGEGRPTGALDGPGTLDATRCLSYWTQAPDSVPEDFRAALGAQVYGCDICQDVCPWNRGVQKRRSSLPEEGDGHVDLVAWLEADGRELVDSLDRLYVPRNDARWLRRNATVALGNVGRADHVAALERAAAGDDQLVAEHARWALARIAERA